MNALNTNPSDLKLQLFRYIDTLPENKLKEFYNLLILNKKKQETDLWNLLSNWEKDDINAGISDLNHGKFKNIDEVLAKYQFMKNEKTFEIIISERAENNLDIIVNYLNSEWNETVKNNFLESFRKNIKFISKNPFMFQVFSKKNTFVDVL